MEIQRLTGVNPSEFTRCFNEAFSDYLIKFEVTEDYFVNRWIGARIDYGLSYGVWDKEKLVGFIVNGIDERNGIKTAHNNGTGVIPTHRGQRWVDRLYDYALPELKAAGVKCCTLEVICENARAIKVYERIGFEKLRQLHCYSGKLDSPSLQLPGVSIREVAEPDWALYTSFWDVEPAWEQKKQVVELLREHHVVLELRLNGEQTVGYTAFNPSSGNVIQFGVDKAHRGKGYGRVLFTEMNKQVPKIKINNLDSKGTAANAFIQKIGLPYSLSQYEMEMMI